MGIEDDIKYMKDLVQQLWNDREVLNSKINRLEQRVIQIAILSQEYQKKEQSKDRQDKERRIKDSLREVVDVVDNVPVYKDEVS